MIENSSEELPLLTFNSLYNVLREEKKITALQSLPEKFYEAYDKFIKNKIDEIKKLKESNEVLKLTKEKNIYKNSKKIFLNLLNLRANKIAKISIQNQIFSDENIEISNILEFEQEFSVLVSKAVKKLNIN